MEVVYFTQVFIIIFLIIVSLVKLAFFQLECEESTFWFAAVCGPSCFGKTELIFRMLLENTFSPKFLSILYFYQHEQPKFKSLEAKLNIQFTKFSSFGIGAQKLSVGV